MRMILQTTDVVAPGGRMSLVSCSPQGIGPFPAVLVLMESFGVNEHIRDVVRCLALQGYFALAPDLYYRESERSISYESTDRAAGLVMRTMALGEAPEERVKDDRVYADISVALQHLSSHERVDTRQVSVLGYGMGGRLALLTACRLRDGLRAAICYSPLKPLSLLGELKHLQTPVLMLCGARDREVPVPQVDRMSAELGHLGKAHELKIFSACEHGFFFPGRPTFDAQSASEAWSAVLVWLGRYASGARSEA